MKNSNKIFKYFLIWGILSFVSIKVKEIILERLAHNSMHMVSNPFFTFYEVHNKGAAFSLFPDKANVLIIAAVVCIIILTALVLAKSSKLTQSMVSAMALLSAGMTLNTMERIQNGYVTDYLYLKCLKDFPVFNVPDIMIVIGAFMLVFAIISKSR